MKSPIKYFGGKGGCLGIKILNYFPDKSQYNIYIEPFGGGANLLFLKEPYNTEIYNDLEGNVYSLFKVLTDRLFFKEFKRLCDLSIYSRRLRNEYISDLEKDNLDIVQRAYKYFYINRTSINGIGGFSVTAHFIRRNMSKSTSDFLSSIDKLDIVYNRLSSVIIENMDGLELIKRYDQEKVFIYADPPYHHNVRSITRYKVDMNDRQQGELIDVLLSLKKAKVLLSGYDCAEYSQLEKSGWNKYILDETSLVDKISKEVLWSNYSLSDSNKPVDKNKHTKAIVEFSDLDHSFPRGSIPRSLLCKNCHQYKKTNSVVFKDQLIKSKLSKEMFISGYLCRKCRKLKKNGL